MGRKARQVGANVFHSEKIIERSRKHNDEKVVTFAKISTELPGAMARLDTVTPIVHNSITCNPGRTKHEINCTTRRTTTMMRVSRSDANFSAV